eukprot:CAMPEP_0184395094 /NCGR_PEP_ID=MMETSP0007-20130409/42618_1 /TAXON_ID=97485 /ORGANISM="Prymnesium parvum, Strain Texoma1" /LENGTH=77 /DNA_ID=CAMNT_0026747043 /DNA_START=182 /DNA_END=415 /DNA_ORIENTATION=-
MCGAFSPNEASMHPPSASPPRPRPFSRPLAVPHIPVCAATEMQPRLVEFGQQEQEVVDVHLRSALLREPSRPQHGVH